MNIKWLPAPNFTAGRRGYQPLLIVCHIMAGTLAGTRSWFANPASRVSAHFGVGKQGETEQYVRIGDTAWHAGSVRCPLVPLPYPPGINPNLYTVGIEFEGRPGDAMPEAQYQAGVALVRNLLRTIPASDLPIKQRVIGHCQVNSIDRPNCPGSGFPWPRLYADLSDPLAAAVRKLQAAGVVSSPEYWVQHARPGETCQGDHVAALIAKMAAIL